MATGGRTWALSIGGPSNEVCLSVSLDDRISPQTCAGRPLGAPVPDAERYRPLLFEDTRLPRFVFGRVHSAATEVVVEVEAPSAPPNHHGVIEADGESDRFYAVELLAGETPVAVVALDAEDGTTRYPVGP